MPKSSNTLPPGTPTPRSGIYEQVGPRGGRTGEQADSTRGHPLPPTEKPGVGWTLVQPAHHKGKK
jgi:hypothetical protein